jgi:hypothetical protein
VAASTYEHRATAIIEIEMTEDELVKSILIGYHAAAQNHLKSAARDAQRRAGWLGWGFGRSREEGPGSGTSITETLLARRHPRDGEPAPRGRSTTNAYAPVAKKHGRFIRITGQCLSPIRFSAARSPADHAARSREADSTAPAKHRASG